MAILALILRSFLLVVLGLLLAALVAPGSPRWGVVGALGGALVAGAVEFWLTRRGPSRS